MEQRSIHGKHDKHDKSRAQPASTLSQICEAFGCLPNIFQTMADSPATLNATWAVMRALDKGGLTPRIRAAIALRVAQLEENDYCLASLTAQAEKSGIDYTTCIDFRIGVCDDPREQAIINFVSRLVTLHGQGIAAETAQLREKKFSQADITEIVALTALGLFNAMFVRALNVPLDEPEAPGVVEDAFPDEASGDIAL